MKHHGHHWTDLTREEYESAVQFWLWGYGRRQIRRLLKEPERHPLGGLNETAVFSAIYHNKKIEDETGRERICMSCRLHGVSRKAEVGDSLCGEHRKMHDRQGRFGWIAGPV